MSLIQTVENDVKVLATDVWDAVSATEKSLVASFGQTLLSELETAIESVANGSATYSQALASLVAQIPADVQIAEKDLAAGLAAGITALQNNL